MSYGGNADPTGIQVTFLDQTGAKSVKAVIAFSVPVSRILPNIITKMNLPTTSPDGQPMSYSLDHKEGGRRLIESQTLLEAGVQNGDHLIVYPEVVAGRSESGRRCDPCGLDRRVSPTMHESPRIRRLRNDLAALERLRSESSVLRFRTQGKPAQHYLIEFRGKSLARERGKVAVRDRHEVEIKLGASYPRTMPEIRWLTPIYHPNISEIGMVCLGGYGTHWVPSLNLDELCGMLWDMARYHNYDIRSPYNREAALWVANQTTFRFPLDARPLRDLRAALGRVRTEPKLEPATAPPPSAPEPMPEPVETSDTPKLKPEPDTPGSKAHDFIRRVLERRRTRPPPSPLRDRPGGSFSSTWRSTSGAGPCRRPRRKRSCSSNDPAWVFPGAQAPSLRPSPTGRG